MNERLRARAHPGVRVGGLAEAEEGSDVWMRADKPAQPILLTYDAETSEVVATDPAAEPQWTPIKGKIANVSPPTSVCAHAVRLLRSRTFPTTALSRAGLSIECICVCIYALA